MASCILVCRRAYHLLPHREKRTIVGFSALLNLQVVWREPIQKCRAREIRSKNAAIPQDAVEVEAWRCSLGRNRNARPIHHIDWLPIRFDCGERTIVGMDGVVVEAARGDAGHSLVRTARVPRTGNLHKLRGPGSRHYGPRRIVRNAVPDSSRDRVVREAHRQGSRADGH